MNDILEFLKNNYGTISAIFSGIASIYIFGRKWVKYAIRTIRVGNNFYSVFGNTPASVIKEICDSIRNSHNALEIRQSISEKYMQIGIFMCEPKTGKCIWTNQYINDLFGLDSTHMKGFGWLTVISEEDRIRVRDTWVDSVENNSPYDCIYIIQNQRTKTFYKVKAHAIDVLDDDNKIVCYVGYITILQTKEPDGRWRKHDGEINDA